MNETPRLIAPSDRGGKRTRGRKTPQGRLCLGAILLAAIGTMPACGSDADDVPDGSGAQSSTASGTEDPAGSGAAQGSSSAVPGPTGGASGTAAGPSGVSEEPASRQPGSGESGSMEPGGATSDATPQPPALDTLAPDVDGDVTLRARLFPRDGAWPLVRAGFCWSDAVTEPAELDPRTAGHDDVRECAEAAALPTREDRDLLLNIGPLEGERRWWVQAFAENDTGLSVGGVVAFATSVAPPAVAATQGTYLNRVEISWEPPDPSLADGWEEVRIYRGDDEVPVHVEQDPGVRVWGDRDAPRPVPVVDNIALQVGEQRQGALLTWDEAEVPESPVVTWRVVGVLWGTASEPAEAAGWVMRERFPAYAFTPDDGETWIDTGTARGWVYEDAPAPVPVAGTLSARTEGAVVQLAAEGMDIVPGAPVDYRVRAQVEGATSLPSPPVRGQRTGGTPWTYRWERGPSESGPWTLLDTTDDAAELVDETPSESEPWYRVQLVAPHLDAFGPPPVRALPAR